MSSAAERIHADDTTVPVLAKGKTRTGRLWTYVRDDRPFGGPDPPAAVYFYSPDRSGEHPERIWPAMPGIMQADAYAGFSRLYEPTASRVRSSRRRAGPMRGASSSSWRGSTRRRSPSRPSRASMRFRHRARHQRPFAATSACASARSAAARSSRTWKTGCASNAPSSRAKQPVAKAIDYMPQRAGTRLHRFLDDGRICMSNNAAERALRGIALGRRNWTFAGSDEGGQRAAAIYTLIETAKLNDVDPQAWLADVLAACRITRPSASTSSCPGTGNWLQLNKPPLNQQQPPRPSPDAYVDKGSELACRALERIGLLYDIETAIRGHQPAERQAVRQAHAGPVLEALRQWLNTTLRRVPGRSDLAAAIRYARPRWEQLCRYR